MNRGHTDNSLRGLQRLIIFTAFSAGLIFPGYISPHIDSGGNLVRNLFLTSIPMAAVLISSSSVMGFLLIPLCSVFFGAISRLHAEHLIEAYLTGPADAEGFIIFIISVPVFFVVSVRGMEASRILLSAMNSGSASSRNAYEREYIPMTLAVISAAAAVCFITG